MTLLQQVHFFSNYNFSENDISDALKSFQVLTEFQMHFSDTSVHGEIVSFKFRSLRCNISDVFYIASYSVNISDILQKFQILPIAIPSENCNFLEQFQSTAFLKEPFQSLYR